MPPNRSGGLLRKIELLWAVLWASNTPKMLWWLGLRPGPHCENSRSHRLLTQGWTEGGGQGDMPPKPWIKKLTLSCRVTHIDALAVAAINYHRPPKTATAHK